MTDPAEFVLVPREPTEALLTDVGPMEGFESGYPNADACHRKWWADMIAAASAAPNPDWPSDEAIERAIIAALWANTAYSRDLVRRILIAAKEIT